VRSPPPSRSNAHAHCSHTFARLSVNRLYVCTAISVAVACPRLAGSLGAESSPRLAHADAAAVNSSEREEI
jgi:hypothetical protein